MNIFLIYMRSQRRFVVGGYQWMMATQPLVFILSRQCSQIPVSFRILLSFHCNSGTCFHCSCQNHFLFHLMVPQTYNPQSSKSSTNFAMDTHSPKAYSPPPFPPPSTKAAEARSDPTLATSTNLELKKIVGGKKLCRWNLVLWTALTTLWQSSKVQKAWVVFTDKVYLELAQI